MWAYFDTSALVKAYFAEPGRRMVVGLLRRHTPVASVVLPIEIAAAVRRRAADGSLDAAGLARIRKRVSADRAYWTLVEIRRDVLSDAEALAVSHALRTLEALHVASARFFAARLPMSRLLFVSADRRQTDAAAAIGLTTRFIRS